jgi:hypothetical protein
MLFPNFYVPSVSERIVATFESSRMSLSHPGGRDQGFCNFHSGFMLERGAGGAEPPRADFLPARWTCASNAQVELRRLQLSPVFRVE